MLSYKAVYTKVACLYFMTDWQTEWFIESLAHDYNRIGDKINETLLKLIE